MKINVKIIKEIETEAKKYFVNCSGCHDWTHVERVYKLAVRIAKKEKADMNIIKMAVYLHDIGRKEEMDSKGKICHAEKGVELAQEILAKYNLDKAVIENIKHCILSHRNKNNHDPKSIEAKVLFDADKLDSIGAVGVARDFLFAGYAGCAHLYTGNEKKLLKNARNYAYTEEDSALLEYYYSIKKIKSKILTKTGKEIAEERHKFMADFFKRFELEIKGVL
ncbi:MAG: HD domain-containing protein [Candidatus Paceibacterota bacterium]